MTYDGQDKYRAAYAYGIERFEEQALDDTRPESQDPLYYLYDGLGSVSQMVRPNGEVRDHYGYDEFGVPAPGAKLSEDGRNVNHNSFGYTGESWDEEDNLLYLRARYYQPDIGRFTTRDMFPGYTDTPLTMNKYAYVGNNPVNNIDPLGLIWLKYGDSNAQVAQAKKWLSDLDPFYNPVITNAFDFEMLLAVDNFKELNKIYNKDDCWGVIGDITWAAIERQWKNKFGYPQGTGKDELIDPKDLAFSNDGINFVKDYEKLRLEVYDASVDNSGDWTIGWGHKLYGNELKKYRGKKITRDEADALFATDVKRMEDTSLKPLLIDNNIKLNQHQYDALVSFTFNRGEYYWGQIEKNGKHHALAQAILDGDYNSKKIMDAFMTYVNKTRRKQEANMFLYGNYDSTH
ncbi:MAG: RHS repeat-associated core domain-containing protein [Eubacteriales bacterium]